MSVPAAAEAAQTVTTVTIDVKAIPAATAAVMGQSLLDAVLAWKAARTED